MDKNTRTHTDILYIYIYIYHTYLHPYLHISYHIISYHIISYIISYPFISYHIILYAVGTSFLILWDVPWSSEMPKPRRCAVASMVGVGSVPDRMGATACGYHRMIQAEVCRSPWFHLGHLRSSCAHWLIMLYWVLMIYDYLFMSWELILLVQRVV